jgi:hypothetical protein
MSILLVIPVSIDSERPGLACRFRSAGGTVTVKIQVAAAIMAAACLAAAGCSALRPGSNSATGLVKNSSSASASAPLSQPGPPADPFTGTPADHWADGAAGIVLPVAEPVGGFTTAQVAYAYQTARKLLVAANLDKQTLLGGVPTAFADLLTSPQKTWFEQNLNKKGVDKNGADLSSRGLVMSFAPGSAQLIGSVIKVNGTMHAKATVDDGSPVLDIDVDYLFTYPVEPPHQPYNWMRIVNEVAWTVAFANWQGAASSFAPWVNSVTDVGGVAGAKCGTGDGYQHPDYPDNTASGAQPTVSPSGAPENPYVGGQSRVRGCQASTGT